jgi:hypothetical protein
MGCCISRQDDRQPDQPETRQLHHGARGGGRLDRSHHLTSTPANNVPVFGVTNNSNSGNGHNSPVTFPTATNVDAHRYQHYQQPLSSGSSPVSPIPPHSQAAATAADRLVYTSLPLGDRYNRPIHQIEWSSKSPITLRQLKAARQEFWETRVTANADVWNALRTAVELLLEFDIGTAQGIIDAAGVTVPTGVFLFCFSFVSLCFPFSFLWRAY